MSWEFHNTTGKRYLSSRHCEAESSFQPWHMALVVRRVNVHVWPKIQLLRVIPVPSGMFWTIKVSVQHMTSEKPVSFGLAAGGKTGYPRLLNWYMFIMCATSLALVPSSEVALWLHEVLTVRRTYTLEQYVRTNWNSERIQKNQEDLSETFSLQKFYTSTKPWKADKMNHRTLQLDKSNITE